MNDPFELQRFIDAQEGSYQTALLELRDGAKQSHWMWFIFPQFSGLGCSPTAQYFSIRSGAEARAYLDHPILGARLRECVGEVLRWASRRTADEILGHIDSMKLRSSLTLFDRFEPQSTFGLALAAFFDGLGDERTLALLNADG